MYSDAAINVTWSLPTETALFCSLKSPVGEQSDLIPGLNFPGFGVSKSAFATCSEPGVYKFKVFRNGDATTIDTFFITVNDGKRYSWYLTLASSNSTNVYLEPVKKPIMKNQISYIRIWLLDYSSASNKEITGSAVTPSKQSRQITNGLYEMGEVPTITLTGLMGIPITLISSTLTFSSALGYG